MSWRFELGRPGVAQLVELGILRRSLRLKASVIIPTKNPGAIFERVLEAVLGQRTTFGFEVVVIDSGSTDGTLEFVRRQRDSRLRLIEVPAASFGHGRTRNYAISLSRGDFAAMLTHDALPASSAWLENLVACVDKSPLIAGVFGRHLAHDSASPFTVRDLNCHFSQFSHELVVRIEDRGRYESELGYRQWLHFFSDNNALIRRSVWERIPYPDVNFAEDQLWAKLILEAGFEKAYAPEAVVFHSHEFGAFETLQRSFDESRAFRVHFGYRLCPSLTGALRSIAGLCVQDLRFAFSEGLLWRRPSLVARTVLCDAMRVGGHFLGDNSARVPGFLQRVLSRDGRIAAAV